MNKDESQGGFTSLEEMLKEEKIEGFDMNKDELQEIRDDIGNVLEDTKKDVTIGGRTFPEYVIWAGIGVAAFVLGGIIL